MAHRCSAIPPRSATRIANTSSRCRSLDLAARAWQPRYLKWTFHIARAGALTRKGIPTAHALTEEVAAALPGTPMAIPTPGHTGGHCSYVVDGVLVSGDALVTGHPVSTHRGPQLLPGLFNHDQPRLRPQPVRARACSTPTSCCPGMARYGADRSGGGRAGPRRGYVRIS